MEYENRWEIIEGIGEGGQGKVYRVLDKEKLDTDPSNAAHTAVRALNERVHDSEYITTNTELFRQAVLGFIRQEDPANHGALKVLHKLEARDAELAEERIKNEIKAMQNITHSNLLKILDYDKDDWRWFVSEFHQNGTLHDYYDNFTGNFAESIKAFRPFVEGVSELHKNRYVHRDIKPLNVFISTDGNLILGDFGIIFFDKDDKTRISKTFDNVGSRDWMPVWAYSMRIEDVSPAFDVFSLGKLLWAMISNKPVFPVWYFDEPENNLEKMFPDDPGMKIANNLFAKCIVEREHQCLKDASELLGEIDRIISIIDKNADIIDSNVERPCRVCGIGKYMLAVDKDNSDTNQFGLSPTSKYSFKIFTCDHCGNVQLFSFKGRISPPAWENEAPPGWREEK